MSDLVTLKPKLIRLKLSGVLESLELRMREAQEQQWDYTTFLTMLLDDEVQRRDAKQLNRRFGKSGVDPQKTLATFDFDFNPSVHKPTILEIASCRFLEHRHCVFFVGPSGVGKSHLAQAVGHEALMRGVDVLYRNTYELMSHIYGGKADGSHERRLATVASVPLLILDDFGLRDLNAGQQEDLYELICRRYERHATIITSNRDFSEWQGVFSNQLMGSAAMDRLVHRAIKIVIEGKSYRMHSFKQSTNALQNVADGAKD